MTKAQELLARYKTATALPTEHKGRLLDVVSERVARGDLPRIDILAPAPVVPEPALLGQLWASAWGKAGVGLLALGLPSASYYALQGTDAPAAAPTVTSAARVTPSPAPLQPTKLTSEADPAPPSTTAKVEEAEPPSRQAHAARPERSASAASGAEPTIDEEVRLLNAAQKALQSGEPQRALGLLSEHATRFPRGKLGSARQVTRMMALCQAGQAEKARQEATQFVAQNPASPFVDRVKGICAVGSKTP